MLVRYSFPGKKIVDALVKPPFALPTDVAGISLTALLASNGRIDGLLEPYGIQLAFSRYGVVIALIFIGLPYVVCTVLPVLKDAEKVLEEAPTSHSGIVAKLVRAIVVGPVAPNAVGRRLVFAW